MNIPICMKAIQYYAMTHPSLSAINAPYTQPSQNKA